MNQTEKVTPPVRVVDNQRFLFLLLVNVALAALWPIFLPAQGAIDYLYGLVVGALALSVYERRYGRRILWFWGFVFFVLWEMIVSNVKLVWLIMQRQPRLAPGIVAIPLRVTTGLEITILASVITLTPGTLSIDLGQNDEGDPVLYVHTIQLIDPDAFRREIQDNFERRLLLVTRGRGV